MPDCEKYLELCSASLDGELTREEKKELFEHLSECPACAAYLEDLRQMHTAWEDMKEPLPDELHEHIMKAIVSEAKKNTPRKNKRPFPVFTALSAAAACVMLVLSGAVTDIIGISTTEQVSDKPKPTGRVVIEDFEPKNKTRQNEQNIQQEAEENTPQQNTVDNDGQTEEQNNNAVTIEPQNNQVQDEPKQTIEPPEQKPQQDMQNYDKQTGESKDQRIVKSEQGGKESPPAVFAMQGEERENKAQTSAVKIPPALQTSNFAFCYVAVGESEVPNIQSCELIESSENIYYFKVNGSISDFEKNISLLQENKFDTAMRNDLGVKINSAAEYGLLIVILN